MFVRHCSHFVWSEFFHSILLLSKYRTFRCLHKGKDEIDHRWIKKFLEILGGAEAEVDKKVDCGTQFTGHCATISSGALKGASFFQAVISGWSTRWERKSLL